MNTGNTQDMCGRFTQHYIWAEVHEFLSVFGAPRNLRPRYNIGPTTDIDVVRLRVNGRELVSMRWGLAPFFWKKKLEELPATFNARAETLAEKPMFRDAYHKRRCIIPASGFYEWTGPKDDKQSHLFTAADGSPILAFAGLWDQWHDPEADQEILSCTIVVTDASEWRRSYHDRMPIMLIGDDIAAWLNSSLGIHDVLPASATALREWPRAAKADHGRAVILPSLATRCADKRLALP